MYTLLIRLKGPMQAWGIESHFRYRDTGLEPSLSGVVGVLASALGRDRSESISDIASAKFGVRVLREGRLLRDFHTYEHYSLDRDNYIQRGKIGLSFRDFISGADFLAGMEFEEEALPLELHSALRNPRWFTYLGRKSFVPSLPLWTRDGVVPLPLVDALRAFDFESGNKKSRYVIDEDERYESGAIARRIVADRPVSYLDRKFYARKTMTIFFDNNCAEGTNVSD